ncbi:MAG: geranylgeranyl reductase family protein [Chloroflexota bacterium]
MTEQHYDAIVVGAGPAGAVAAYELARAGLRTLLIEKAKLPRYKTCGGGITYKSARALPFAIDSVCERVLYKAEFSWRSTKPFVAQYEQPLVYMVQRSKFDNLLVEQAAAMGAEVMDDTLVQSVEADETGATVNTTRGSFSADNLVGADGATGRVARSLGFESHKWAIAALESEVEVEQAVMDRWIDRMGLDLGELKGAYGWVFPKGDHLSVGVGGVPMIGDYGSHLKRYNEKHTINRVPGNAIKRVIGSHGYKIPARQAGAPVQKGRALLVGDAAGLVEVLTGEGIFWAIRSAQIAAQSILSDHTATYGQRLDAILMPDLMSSRRWLGLYALAPNVCYHIPKRMPVIWRAMCKIGRGDRRFSDIRRELGPFGFLESLLPDPLLVADNA